MTGKPTVEIDLGLCIGNAMCRMAAPAAFVEAPGGQSQVADPDAESADALLQAAAECPVGAITVRDGETGEALELPW